MVWPGAKRNEQTKVDVVPDSQRVPTTHQPAVDSVYGAIQTSAANWRIEMLVYPLVIIMHMSNPTAPPPKEITHDFIGGGIGLEHKGFSVEATLGAQSFGCAGKGCA